MVEVSVGGNNSLGRQSLFKNDSANKLGFVSRVDNKSLTFLFIDKVAIGRHRTDGHPFNGEHLRLGVS